MIKLTNIDGRHIVINPDHIVDICEAGASAAWHGVRAYVRMAGGVTHEVRQTVGEILRRFEDEEGS